MFCQLKALTKEWQGKIKPLPEDGKVKRKANPLLKDDEAKSKALTDGLKEN